MTNNTPTPPAPAAVATDGPNSPGAVYDACRRATAPADDAREKGLAAYDALNMREKSEIAAQAPRYCYAKGYVAALAGRAADASGAEAMRERAAKLCDEVAAEDLADEREADEAGDDQLSAMARESVRTATYLAETIRALPLPGATPDATRVPARDDAVEEALAPGCHEHVALWDAINAYSVACGGHPTRGGGARMDAVVRVEKALRAALRREKESRSDDSRPASGQGGDK